MREAAKKAGRYLLTRQVLLSWGATDAADALHRIALEQLGGGQETQRSRPDNRLRPAVDTELAIDVAGVGLDCVR